MFPHGSEWAPWQHERERVMLDRYRGAAPSWRDRR